MEEQLSGHADADGGPLPAEAGKGLKEGGNGETIAKIRQARNRVVSLSSDL
jgi:hypothetical protein